jgi:hypothetical protein
MARQRRITRETSNEVEQPTEILEEETSMDDGDAVPEVAEPPMPQAPALQVLRADYERLAADCTAAANKGDKAKVAELMVVKKAAFSLWYAESKE